MQTEIWVAILSLVGTLVGSLAGILTANRRSEYRIARLEEEVNKHNRLIERTYRIEERLAVLDQREKVSEHRIDDLENKKEGD